MASAQTTELYTDMIMRVKDLSSSGFNSFSTQAKNAQMSVSSIKGVIDNIKDIAIGNVFGSLGGVAIQDSIGQLGALGSKLISTNAQVEQLHQTFQVLYQGNSGQADAAVGYLTKLSTQAPFTRQSLLDAGVQIASLGLNITQVMPELGNLAAAMGQNMTVASQAMTDAFEGRFYMMQRDLHVTKDQLAALQGFHLEMDNTGHVIQSSLIPALENYINTMGLAGPAAKKAQDALNAALDSGKITQAEYLKQLDQLNAKYGQAGEKGSAMALQMKTFSGIMTNLKDEMFIFEQAIGKPMFETVKKSLGDFIFMMQGEAFAKGGSPLQTFEKVAGDALGKITVIFFTAARLILEEVPKIFEIISKTFKDVQPILEKGAAVIGGVVMKINETFKSLGSSALTGALVTIAAIVSYTFISLTFVINKWLLVFALIGIVVKKVAMDLEPLSGTLQKVGSAFMAVTGWVSAFATMLAQNLINPIENIIGSFARLAKTLVGDLYGLQGPVGAIGKYITFTFASFIQETSQIIDSLAPTVETIFIEIGRIVGTTIVPLSTLAIKTFNAVAKIVEDIAPGIQETFTLIGESIQRIVPPLFQVASNIVDVFGPVATSVLQTFISLLRPIIAGFTDVALAITNVDPKGIASLASNIESLATTIASVLRPAIAEISVVVIAAIAPIASLVLTVFNQINTIVTAVAPGMRAAFITIGDGIRQILPPLLQVASTIVSTFAPVVATIINAFTSLAGPVVAGVEQISTALTAVNATSLGALAGNMQSLATVIASVLRPAIAGIAAIFAAAIGPVESVLGTIVNAVDTVAIQMVSPFRLATGQIVQSFTDTIGPLAAFANRLINIFTPVVATILTAFLSLVAPITGAIHTIVNALNASINLDNFAKIGSYIQSSIGYITPIVATLVTGLGNIFATLVPLVSSIFSFLMANVSNTLRALEPVVIGLINYIVGSFQQVIPPITNTINTLVPLFNNVAGTMTTSMLSATRPIVSSVETVKSAFDSISPDVIVKSSNTAAASATTNFNSLAVAASSVFGIVAAVAGAAFQAIVAGIGPVVDAVGAAMETIPTIIKDALATINVSGMLDAIKTIIGSLLALVAVAMVNLTDIFNSLVTPAIGVFNTIVTSINDLFDALTPDITSTMAIIATTIGRIGPPIANLANSILTIFTPVVANIGKAFLGLATPIANVVDSVTGTLARLGPGAFGAVASAATNIVAVFSAAVPKIIGALSPLANDVVALFVALATNVAPVVARISDAFAALAVQVAPYIADVGNLFTSKVVAFLPTLATFFSNIVGLAQSVASALVSSIGPAAVKAFGAFLDAVKTVADAIAAFVNNNLGTLRNTLDGIASFIGGTVATVLNALTSIFQLVAAHAWILIAALSILGVKAFQVMIDGATRGVQGLREWVSQLRIAREAAATTKLGVTYQEAKTGFIDPAAQIEYDKTILSINESLKENAIAQNQANAAYAAGNISATQLVATMDKLNKAEGELTGKVMEADIALQASRIGGYDNALKKINEEITKINANRINLRPEEFKKQLAELESKKIVITTNLESAKWSPANMLAMEKERLAAIEAAKSNRELAMQQANEATVALKTAQAEKQLTMERINERLGIVDVDLALQQSSLAQAAEQAANNRSLLTIKEIILAKREETVATINGAIVEKQAIAERLNANALAYRSIATIHGMGIENHIAAGTWKNLSAEERKAMLASEEAARATAKQAESHAKAAETILKKYTANSAAALKDAEDEVAAGRDIVAETKKMIEADDDRVASLHKSIDAANELIASIHNEAGAQITGAQEAIKAAEASKKEADQKLLSAQVSEEFTAMTFKEIDAYVAKAAAGAKAAGVDLDVALASRTASAESINAARAAYEYALSLEAEAKAAREAALAQGENSARSITSSGAFGKLGSAVSSFGSELVGTATSMIRFMGPFIILGVAMTALGLIYNAHKKEIDALINTAVAPLSAAMQQLAGVVNAQISVALKYIADNILPPLVSWITKLTAAFDGSARSARELRAAMSGINAGPQGGPSALARDMHAPPPAAVPAQSGLFQTLTASSKIATDTIKQQFDGMVLTIQGALGMLRGAWEMLWGVVKVIMDVAVAAITGDFSGLGDSIANDLKGIGAGFVDFAAGAVKVVTAPFLTAYNTSVTLFNDLEALLGKFIGFVADWAGNLASGFIQALAIIPIAIGNFIDSSMKRISDLIQALTHIDIKLPGILGGGEIKFGVNIPKFGEDRSMKMADMLKQEGDLGKSIKDSVTNSLNSFGATIQNWKLPTVPMDQFAAAVDRAGSSIKKHADLVDRTPTGLPPRPLDILGGNGGTAPITFPSGWKVSSSDTAVLGMLRDTYNANAKNYDDLLKAQLENTAVAKGYYSKAESAGKDYNTYLKLVANEQGQLNALYKANDPKAILKDLAIITDNRMKEIAVAVREHAVDNSALRDLKSSSATFNVLLKSASNATDATNKILKTAEYDPTLATAKAMAWYNERATAIHNATFAGYSATEKAVMQEKLLATANQHLNDILNSTNKDKSKYAAEVAFNPIQDRKYAAPTIAAERMSPILKDMYDVMVQTRDEDKLAKGTNPALTVLADQARKNYLEAMAKDINYFTTLARSGIAVDPKWLQALGLNAATIDKIVKTPGGAAVARTEFGQATDPAAAARAFANYTNLYSFQQKQSIDRGTETNIAGNANIRKAVEDNKNVQSIIKELTSRYTSIMTNDEHNPAKLNSDLMKLQQDLNDKMLKNGFKVQGDKSDIANELLRLIAGKKAEGIGVAAKTHTSDLAAMSAYDPTMDTKRTVYESITKMWGDAGQLWNDFHEKQLKDARDKAAGKETTADKNQMLDAHQAYYVELKKIDEFAHTEAGNNLVLTTAEFNKLPPVLKKAYLDSIPPKYDKMVTGSDNNVGIYQATLFSQKQVLAEMKQKYQSDEAIFKTDLAQGKDGNTLLNDLKAVTTDYAAYVKQQSKYGAATLDAATIAGLAEKPVAPMTKELIKVVSTNIKDMVASGDLNAKDIGAQLYTLNTAMKLAKYTPDKIQKIDFSTMEPYWKAIEVNTRAKLSVDAAAQAPVKTLLSDIKEAIINLQKEGEKDPHKLLKAQQDMMRTTFGPRVTSDKDQLMADVKSGNATTAQIQTDIFNILQDMKLSGATPSQLRMEQYALQSEMNRALKAQSTAYDFGSKIKTTADTFKAASFGGTEAAFGLKRDDTTAQIIARLEAELQQARQQNLRLEQIIEAISNQTKTMKEVAHNTNKQVNDPNDQFNKLLTATDTSNTHLKNIDRTLAKNDAKLSVNSVGKSLRGAGVMPTPGI